MSSATLPKCIISGNEFVGLHKDSLQNLDVIKNEKGKLLFKSVAARHDISVNAYSGDIQLKDSVFFVLDSELGQFGNLRVGEGGFSCEKPDMAAHVMKLLSIPFGYDYSAADRLRHALLFSSAFTTATGYTSFNDMSPDQYNTYRTSNAYSMFSTSCVLHASALASAKHMHEGGISKRSNTMNDATKRAKTVPGFSDMQKSEQDKVVQGMLADVVIAESGFGNLKSRKPLRDHLDRFLDGSTVSQIEKNASLQLMERDEQSAAREELLRNMMEEHVAWSNATFEELRVVLPHVCNDKTSQPLTVASAENLDVFSLRVSHKVMKAPGAGPPDYDSKRKATPAEIEASLKTINSMVFGISKATLDECEMANPRTNLANYEAVRDVINSGTHSMEIPLACVSMTGDDVDLDAFPDRGTARWNAAEPGSGAVAMMQLRLMPPWKSDRTEVLCPKLQFTTRPLGVKTIMTITGRAPNSRMHCAGTQVAEVPTVTPFAKQFLNVREPAAAPVAQPYDEDETDESESPSKRRKLEGEAEA